MKTNHLRFVTLIVFVIFGSGITYWYWPKLYDPNDGSGRIIFYHGMPPSSFYLRLPNFNPQWYIRPYLVKCMDEYGSSSVNYSREGYNSFFGSYSNGVIREEGVCWVDQINGWPYPDRHKIFWGKYYSPDKMHQSIVTNGTGIQLYWTTNGVPIWQLVLSNYHRVKLVMLHNNGQLFTKVVYKDGKAHGVVTSYNEHGEIKSVVTNW